jgi:trimeric autotransporter adhesin
MWVYYLSYNSNDTANDTITGEVAGAAGGIDTAYAVLSVTSLADHVENLTFTLLGNIATLATGNAGDNIITGNSANNTLAGGAGKDTLAGGAGNDVFVFDSSSFLNAVITGTSIDKISDFNTAQDKIQLN